MNIANQINFKETDGEITAVAPVELQPIAETLNDIGAWAWEELWQPALDTLNGKRAFPYWTGGDSMEIRIEEDGTWFREQDADQQSNGIKISNQDAKLIIERFLQAYKDASA